MFRTIISAIIKDLFEDRKDICNYRLNMTFSIFLKILENSLLNIMKDYVVFNNMYQYFSKKNFTSAAFMLEETISRYLNKSSVVHSSLLDLRKAFDKVNHKIAFKKLSLINPRSIINRKIVRRMINRSVQIT